MISSSMVLLKPQTYNSDCNSDTSFSYIPSSQSCAREMRMDSSAESSNSSRDSKQSSIIKYKLKKQQEAIKKQAERRQLTASQYFEEKENKAKLQALLATPFVMVDDEIDQLLNE